MVRLCFLTYLGTTVPFAPNSVYKEIWVKKYKYWGPPTMTGLTKHMESEGLRLVICDHETFGGLLV